MKHDDRSAETIRQRKESTEVLRMFRTAMAADNGQL
jgi:hypothetical protein